MKTEIAIAPFEGAEEMPRHLAAVFGEEGTRAGGARLLAIRYDR